jgi:sulfur carrier protein ThiS
MKIEVKCFATLAPHTPAEGNMDVPPQTSVNDIMRQLGIARDDVKIIFINGAHVEPEALLNEGDRLGLFPAVGGG